MFSQIRKKWEITKFSKNEKKLRQIFLTPEICILIKCKNIFFGPKVVKNAVLGLKKPKNVPFHPKTPKNVFFPKKGKKCGK